MCKRFKRTQGHVWDNTNVTLMLRSFNGLEPGGLELTDKKVKERKRLIFLGLRRKPIKPLARGFLCSWRPQMPSQWGEGAERLLRRVLGSSLFGQESELREPLRSRGSAWKRERGREREDTGTRALMEQRCFNQHGVGIYTVLQGSYSQQR